MKLQGMREIRRCLTLRCFSILFSLILLLHPSIYICTHPYNSALDNESEQAVQDALDTLLKTNKEMTTVIVAHRLRTVRNADMIAFIEKGKVVEKGTHNELIKLPKGHYRKMVERAGADGQLPDQY